MQQKGFTLIEMMVAIIVLAILAVIAVPSFRTASINQRPSMSSLPIFTLRKPKRSNAARI